MTATKLQGVGRERPKRAKRKLVDADAFAEMRRVGAMMSNLCFNFSQNPERPLEAGDRELMEGLYRRWDSALNVLHGLHAPAPNGRGT